MVQLLYVQLPISHPISPTSPMLRFQVVEAIVEGPGVVLHSARGRRRYVVATARCSAKVWPHGWDLDSEIKGARSNDVNMDIVQVSP